MRTRAGDAAPRSYFVRQGPAVERGAAAAVYEGWHRTDASDEVRVRLPGDTPGREHALRLAADKTIRLAR